MGEKTLAIKIEPFVQYKDQTFQDGESVYIITTLIDKSSHLEVKEMPLEHLNLFNYDLKDLTMRDFIGHMKSVLDADLNYPIILDEDGYVMDGRHRVAKALLEEKDTIKFVRFEVTPDPDYYKAKEGK